MGPILDFNRVWEATPEPEILVCLDSVAILALPVHTPMPAEAGVSFIFPEEVSQ
jgi:hypothetical protein